MKLRKMLFWAFFVLTFIPVALAMIMLYKSGLELSKESYRRNLIESINVQSDYIAQTIENNMISDYRFATRSFSGLSGGSGESGQPESEKRYAAFQSYLEVSEDKITASMLLDKVGSLLYTTGEKSVLDTLSGQLPELEKLKDPYIMEFNLGEESYSLGSVTPVLTSGGVYEGCLISVYDRAYIFKIISSYYEIADTSTYLCRENGEVINSRGLPDKELNNFVEQTMIEMTFDKDGMINVESGSVPLSGYYRNIHNTPWYLAGVVDQNLVSSFTNQFIVFYILLILAVFVIDVILVYYFSQKVVEPINALIKVMDGFQISLSSGSLQAPDRKSYYEAGYLWDKFLNLMKTILLVEHNFEGVYQLYQSSAMDDTNIDIDVKEQTIHSNKTVFQELLNQLELPKEACVVERFTNCFCDKDRDLLMDMFVKMRDEHLSVTCEAEIYTPYFNQKWFHCLVVPMYDGNRLSRLFVQLRDVSSFKKQEFASFEQARHDALTHLYNRAGFEDCVGKILQGGSSLDTHGLLFIDMNYFKMVNDNFGHSAGDELLRTVGCMLQDIAGPDGITSRQGGDEFAVFLPRATSEEAEQVKRTLEEKLAFPYKTETITFVVSASIGISMWSPSEQVSLEMLLQEADAKMYQSKREFKEAVVI